MKNNVPIQYSLISQACDLFFACFDGNLKISNDDELGLFSQSDEKKTDPSQLFSGIKKARQKPSFLG
jgi:hypothetical protein